MIKYEEKSGEFHLSNKYISYIIKISEGGELYHIYFGKRIREREDFSHLLKICDRPLAIYSEENEIGHSLQYTQREYPFYGGGDFRYPAMEIAYENGSRISCFKYSNHKIYQGKKKLEGLPSSYALSESDAHSLEICLEDSLSNTLLTLSYSIYEEMPLICKSVRLLHRGEGDIRIEKVFSSCLDLPDSDYELLHLSGAWSRERHIKKRSLEQGIQGIYSMRGASSAEHNPFIALLRKGASEEYGEVLGFSLVYSGNHLEQVEVDTDNAARVLIGIHPDTFSWNLKKGESFQSPEAIIVYSDSGLNAMSRSFHKFFNTRLVNGYWKDRERPILINNWEATEMDFDEKKILDIAIKAKEAGIELFVLDDGWFGERNNDKSGLGDWYVKNFKKLPEGVSGLSKKIRKLGMKFGLWFEPEMVNKNSDLYRKHPDWVIAAPDRNMSQGRNQYVLDFSNPLVVEYIYRAMKKVISEAGISYIKWDMNRYITECYSAAHQAKDQGKIFHKYILGVYGLYEKLKTDFPEVLFESCSSGGARSDPGMLYYAPQSWISDDTDAIERLKIQYGTSIVYPISSMGAHISAVPNQQNGRMTPMKTRANVAFFGAFGYELDLNELTKEGMEEVKEQVRFVKKHRKLLQYGDFYRLQNPFEGNIAAWMSVSEDKQEAIVGYYRILGEVNKAYKRLKLQGLDEKKLYMVNGDEKQVYYGDELMYIGMLIEHTWERGADLDFSSELYYLESVIL